MQSRLGRPESFRDYLAGAAHVIFLASWAAIDLKGAAAIHLHDMTGRIAEHRDAGSEDLIGSNPNRRPVD
jgi:hypothetical protein